MSRMLIVLGICSLLLIGCGGSESGGPETTAVLVDSTSFDVVLLPEMPSRFPAVHPETGRPTLMPALNCPECRKWYPVPPLEELVRIPGATHCPRTGTQLIPDGPLPDEAR